MTKIDNLMETAIAMVQKHLPEDYEVDDVQWCEDGFQFDIYYVRTIDAYNRGPVDRFRFFLSKDETDEENAERFNSRLNEFCEGWENVV